MAGANLPERIREAVSEQRTQRFLSSRLRRLLSVIMVWHMHMYARRAQSKTLNLGGNTDWIRPKPDFFGLGIFILKGVI